MRMQSYQIFRSPDLFFPTEFVIITIAQTCMGNIAAYSVCVSNDSKNIFLKCQSKDLSSFVSLDLLVMY